jgi:hypothetical protein
MGTPFFPHHNATCADVERATERNFAAQQQSACSLFNGSLCPQRLQSGLTLHAPGG